MAAIVSVLVACLSAAPAAAQSQTTTLYVSNAGAPDYASQVVVALAPGAVVDAFEVTLAFDPSIVELTGTEYDSGWSVAAPEPSASPGTVRLAAHGPTNCSAGATCLVATVRFRPVSTGASAIDVADARLTSAGQPVAVATSSGQVTVVAAGSSLQSNAVEEPNAPDTLAPASSSGSDVFSSGILAAAMFLIAIVTAAGAGAILLIALARRTWYTAEPARADRTHIARADPAFQERVSDFLSRVEAFGSVGTHGADNALAVQVAMVSGPGSIATEHADVGDSASDDPAVDGLS